jgi:hypothetical protein
MRNQIYERARKKQRSGDGLICQRRAIHETTRINTKSLFVIFGDAPWIIYLPGNRVKVCCYR